LGDPSDPGTKFTAFRGSSSACADQSRGAEFDGIGRVDTGETGDFTVAICDNGPAGSGMDYFSLVIPAGSYTKVDTVTAGDVSYLGLDRMTGRPGSGTGVKLDRVVAVRRKSLRRRELPPARAVRRPEVRSSQDV